MSEPILAEAIGTIDGVNVDFNTPSAYWPGTLFAYINGTLVREIDDDGPIEMGGTDVRMKLAPEVGDTLHFYYQEEAPTFHGFDGPVPIPPTMLSADELVPEMTGAMSYIPRMISSEDISAESTPEMIEAKELKPKMCSSRNLRPRMISAEEV